MVRGAVGVARIGKTLSGCFEQRLVAVNSLSFGSSGERIVICRPTWPQTWCSPSLGFDKSTDVKRAAKSYCYRKYVGPWGVIRQGYGILPRCMAETWI